MKFITILLLAMFLCAGSVSDTATVSGILSSYQPWYEDRNEENRGERLDRIARGIVTTANEFTCHNQSDECVRKFAGDREELMALLMTAGFWESRYNKRIHAGNCHKDECDHGKARGVYQVQNNGVVPREIWEKSLGLEWEPTLASTQGAAYTFSGAWKSCYRKFGIKGVWGAYARGRCGARYHVITRSRWYQKQLDILRQEL